MYKIRNASILVVIALLLVVSALLVIGVVNDEDRRADSVMKRVVKAVNSQDSETLEGMFSEKALNEVDDFGYDAARLFDLVDEKIVSWERADHPYISRSIEYGRTTKKEVSLFYFVYTSTEKLFCLIDSVPIDKYNPDNVGFYLLLVVKAEEEEKIWDGKQKILFDGRTSIPRYGVYIPFE